MHLKVFSMFVHVGGFVEDLIPDTDIVSGPPIHSCPPFCASVLLCLCASLRQLPR